MTLSQVLSPHFSHCKDCSGLGLCPKPPYCLAEVRVGIQPLCCSSVLSDSLPLTPTQMTETLERHQERLEEKQTACLEQIRVMEKQVRPFLSGPSGPKWALGRKGAQPPGLWARGLGKGFLTPHERVTGRFSWCPRALSNETSLQIFSPGRFSDGPHYPHLLPQSLRRP